MNSTLNLSIGKQYSINNADGVDWSQKDLINKWQQSYIIARCKNHFDSALIYLNTFAGDQVEVFVYDKADPSKITSRPIVFQKDLIVEEDRPLPCITNSGRNCVIYSYNPARQWRRGAGQHNLFAHESPNYHVGHHLFESHEISNFFYPKHCTFEEGMKQIKADHSITGRALSNTWWLSHAGKSSPIMLRHHQAVIGSFLGSKFFLNQRARIFLRELELELPFLKEFYAFQSD